MAGMTASVSSPVLITGFGPFGPHAVNPSQEVVRALQAAPGDDVVAEVLPVSFTGAPAKLGELVRVHRPRAVLSLGLAGAGGPEGLLATVDTAALVEVLTQAGLEAKESWDAGTYVCNTTFYAGVRTGLPAGFLHVPPDVDVAVLAQALLAWAAGYRR